MSEVNTENDGLQKIFVTLMVVGDSLILLGLALIPAVIGGGDFLFTIGATIFIFGSICTLLGLIIMTGMTMKLF